MSAPVLRTTFSAEPSTDELIKARVFAEALLPVGGEPFIEHNVALARTLERVIAARNKLEQLQILQEFVTVGPPSPWQPSVKLHLGSLYASEGFFSRASELWDETWELSKGETDARSRVVADAALAAWATQAMNFGQVERLDARLKEAEGRKSRGAAAQQLRVAREGLAFLVNHHHAAVFSGPEALKMLLAATLSAQRQQALETIKAYKPSHEGTRLSDLANLGARAGLSLRMVYRRPIADIPVPSIVHLRSQHYSAVVGRRDDAYQLRDPILGGELWISREALADEASGYLLVPDDAPLDGWRAVANDEAGAIVGHCAPGMPFNDEPCGPNCGGGGPGPSGGGGSPPMGMPAYTLHPMAASIVIRDTPLGYTPARGPAIRFGLVYNHRVDRQPQVPEYGNLGPMWDFEWQSYVSDNPYYLFGEYWAAVVHFRGEGLEAYSTLGTQHWRSRAVLTKVSHDPPRYERNLPDGTVEVFTLADRAASAFGRRIFLTEVIDPQGQRVTFTYDSSFRLVALTDAVGQVSTLEYLDPAWPLSISTVTDPFGRSATFTYDSLGRLESVTDVAGMTSRFLYGNEDFITAMTTPYGTTSFRSEGSVSGNRFVEATDPAGGVERVEFAFSTMAIPSVLPASEVPSGFAVWNYYLDHYNSFYWDKRAMAEFPGDYSKAVVTNWLFASEVPGGHGWSRRIPHSVKRPGESRIWYDYPDRVSPNVAGTGTSPTKIARVLDDGTTQLTQWAYDSKGMVTSKTDPLGRQTTYSYAPNGLELLEVRQVTPTGTDLLTSSSNYNAQHLPGTVTDGAGQTRTLTHNAGGQVLTVTNAKNETTTYTYDPVDGVLLSVTGAVTGATTTYTYDAYGHVRTMTEPDGYSVTTDYDALGRVVKRTYPDGTFEQFTYERLDLVQERDRLGRLTRHFYDALGRRTATRDPLGRIVRQEWCGCGSLDALIDGNGNRTSWERDVQGRVTHELRADGVTDTLYSYDGIGRLKSITDPKDQVTTHTYLADDSLGSTVYTNAQIATPSVSYTYDPVYPRVATMVDGIGTTTYAYKAPGQLGAGQVASVDGPLTDDTTTYTYDELGRVTTRAINGVGVTWTFDALGRATSEANVLGTFTSTYDGVTSRLATVTYPNGQTSAYSYLPTAQDHRLQTIHHKYPGGATLSKFDYTYDAVGNIQTWRQQADSDPAVLWRYGYDVADQLVAAVKESTDATPVVVRRYAYGYDPGANRTVEQIDDQAVLATHDKLNRLLQHIPGGPLVVAGTVNETATVTIQGKPVPVDSSGTFRGTLTTTVGINPFTIVATDASGNQTARQFEVDSLGQGRTFTYDANGNLTSDGTRTFEWDARNQLVAVDVGTHRSEFSYDGKQRRVRVVEKEGGLTQTDTRVLWCDKQICEERAADGVTVMRRSFGLGEQVAGAARYFTTDHLGSIGEVADGTAALLARYAFDPWGGRTLMAGSDVTSVGYTGHRWLSSGSGWLTQYRFFDPVLGRWASEDPLGFEDGVNLYRYVHNSPVNYVDPSGLQAATATWPWVGKLCVDAAKAASGVLGAAMGIIVTQCGDGCVEKNNGCPPCDPPVGTVGYRLDVVPPSKPHFPHKGSHVHLFIRRQNPKTCECVWNKWMVTEPPPPPGAVPMG